MDTNVSQTRRVCIYAFKDLQSVVDGYIIEFLKQINRYAKIIFISAGAISDKSKILIEAQTVDIVEINKTSNFTELYQKGIELVFEQGYHNLDMLIFANNMIVGPFFDLDSYLNDTEPWDFAEFHLGSECTDCFLMIQRSAFRNEQFESLVSCVRKNQSLSSALREHGFSSKLYMHSPNRFNEGNDPILLQRKNLLIENQCPFLPIDTFQQTYLSQLKDSSGELVAQIYGYLKDNTSFDTDLILEYLLRVQNLADVINTLHLYRVLPTDLGCECKCNLRIALFMHIYYTDMIDECCRYAASMPTWSDIYITTTSAENKDIIKQAFVDLKCSKLTVLLVENQGRDVSALLVGAKPYISQYDLICFAHDKKSSQIRPQTVGKAFFSRCIQSVLSTSEYVEQVIREFSENCRLGLLCSAPPNHAHYYTYYGEEWGENFQETLELADELGLSVDLDKTKEVIAPFGTMFWFRPDALLKLFEKNWTYDDFPKEPNGEDGTILHSIERIYSYVAQDSGYFTAYAMGQEYAQMELVNLSLMLKGLKKRIGQDVGYPVSLLNEKDGFNRWLSLKKIIERNVKNLLKTVMTERGYKKLVGYIRYRYNRRLTK